MELSVHDSTSGSFITEHNTLALQREQHIQHMEDQITELAAHIHAATYRLLELLREYDECNGWGSKGLNFCAHWLNWKCGIGLGANRAGAGAGRWLPRRTGRSRGNVFSLFATHAGSGIRITPKTAQSRWLGEKMDDDLAVLGMLQLE